MQVVLDSLPNEIITNTQWRRDFSRFDDGVGTPRNIQNGRGFRVAYIGRMANNFQMTFAQFDSAALFAADEFFVEVLMERAPGTSANPTVSIARKALSVLDAARR